MTPDSNAFALIVQMLRRSIADNASFPRTELFSEGWMLRLLLESAFSGQGGLLFPILEEARWYSEARLSSAFLARSRRDPWREGHTRADAVVGHYLFRGGTATGLVLTPTATQFVVLEAKMASQLSPKTTTVTGFDQAARTVAAMAWTVHFSKVAVDQLRSLAYYVVAPRDQLTKPTFVQNLATAAIHQSVCR